MTPNYNPFKMGGSYAGLVLGSFLYPLVRINHIMNNVIPFNATQYYNFLIYFGLFGGFLIGWGIHSLFRRFSR